MAAALGALLHDAPRRAALAAAGRAAVEAYDWESVTGRIVEVYETVAAAVPAPASVAVDDELGSMADELQGEDGLEGLDEVDDAGAWCRRCAAGWRSARGRDRSARRDDRRSSVLVLLVVPCSYVSWTRPARPLHARVDAPGRPSTPSSSGGPPRPASPATCRRRAGGGAGAGRPARRGAGGREALGERPVARAAPGRAPCAGGRRLESCARPRRAGPVVLQHRRPGHRSVRLRRMPRACGWPATARLPEYFEIDDTALSR
jgi:hypothetical protein